MDKNKDKVGFIKPKSKKAYTLLELIIVLGITVMLLGLGIGGLISGQRQFTYQANQERVQQLVRDARSLALAGKTYPDYNDYNRNGITTDLMTPANIGVDFDVTAGTVTMFADLHVSATDPNQHEGQYDLPSPFAFNTHSAGKDVALEQYQINPTLALLLSGGARTIFFSPIFADVTFYPTPLTGKFFIYGIKEKTGTRKGCAKIHPVSGVPETASSAECPA